MFANPHMATIGQTSNQTVDEGSKESDRLDPMLNQLCRVCDEPAAGFHFGAFTCEGCKSFFGRTCNNQSVVQECKNNYRCVVDKKNRTACKACRLRKCLIVGMSKSGSRYGRRSNWFKIHCLMQQTKHTQRQQPYVSPTVHVGTNNLTSQLKSHHHHKQSDSLWRPIVSSPSPKSVQDSPSHSPRQDVVKNSNNGENLAEILVTNNNNFDINYDLLRKTHDAKQYFLHQKSINMILNANQLSASSHNGLFLPPTFSYPGGYPPYFGLSPLQKQLLLNSGHLAHGGMLAAAAAAIQGKLLAPNLMTAAAASSISEMNQLTMEQKEFIERLKHNATLAASVISASQATYLSNISNSGSSQDDEDSNRKSEEDILAKNYTPNLSDNSDVDVDETSESPSMANHSSECTYDADDEPEEGIPLDLSRT